MIFFFFFFFDIKILGKSKELNQTRLKSILKLCS
jgi:hypothetical protein